MIDDSYEVVQLAAIESNQIGQLAVSHIGYKLHSIACIRVSLF